MRSSNNSRIRYSPFSDHMTEDRDDDMAAIAVEDTGPVALTEHGNHVGNQPLPTTNQQAMAPNTVIIQQTFLTLNIDNHQETFKFKTMKSRQIHKMQRRCKTLVKGRHSHIDIMKDKKVSKKR